MYTRLAERAATRSAFSQPLQVIAFFDSACGYRPSGRWAHLSILRQESFTECL